MAKAPKWGVNTYVKRTRPSIGRHKKRLNKNEKNRIKNTEDKEDEKVYIRSTTRYKRHEFKMA